MDQLARAIRAFVERAAQGGDESREQFLARYPDLREYLEPMLEEAVEAADDRVLGDFRLIRELGRGGMGVVFEAQQLSLPRRVALKVLGAHLTLRPDSIARFKAEAVTAARLLHPGIVRILAQGDCDQAHWFAMELVRGVTLQSVIERLRQAGGGRLDGGSIAAAVAVEVAVAFPAVNEAVAPVGQPRSHFEAVADLGIQVAEALAYGHAQGVVHRDVKPANILLRCDGTAVLTDFGLARDEDLPGITLSGAFAGTPHYASPEHCKGHGSIDQRSDVFSLGVTLYEMLTLRQPFEGETAQQVLLRIQTEEPPDPQRLRKDLPSDLAAVVLKALEKDPRRRYATAAALAADLRAFRLQLPVQARRASSFERLRRWRRREPAKALLAAVLLLAIPSLAVASGYLWVRAAEIRAGRAELRAQQVQAAVDNGFAGYILEERDYGAGSFDAALALQPDCTEAAVGLLFALLKRDGPTPALAWLESSHAAGLPVNLAALLRCALLLRLSRRDEALQLLAGLPEPRTEFELFTHGLIDRDRGPNEGSRLLEYTERAVLAARRPQLWLHLHWAVFADAAGDAASCRRCAANLLLNWPDEPIACYFAGVALSHVEPERAEQLLRQKLALHADSGVLCCALGLVLRARGQLPAAVAALQQAVRLAPQMATFRYSLGAVQLDAGDVAAATLSLQQACALSPRFVDAFIGLGMALRRAGKTDAALAALQRSIELHPTHEIAHFQLGQLLVQLGRLDEGIAHLRIAAELNHKDPNKWHHLAGALFLKKDGAGGVAAMRRAVDAAPDSERAHELLVQCLRQTGDHDGARAALEAWVEALPQSQRAWTQFGLFCVEPDASEDPRDAPAALWAAHRVLELSVDGSALGWFIRGDAEAQLGRKTAAIEALTHSLREGAMPLSTEERARCEQLLARLGGVAAPATGR